MEFIGDTVCEQFGENKYLFTWRFSKVAFNKSYRSKLFRKVLTKQNVSVCQLVIVPYPAQCVLKFFLILYGYKERSGQKMTLSASFMDGDNSTGKTITSPNVSLGIRTTMKVFEIESWHPLLLTCDSYTFKLKVLLHEDSSFASVDRNMLGEEQKTPLKPVDEAPKSVQYLRELGQDMKSLYTSGDLCDLEIRIGEDTLRAHRLILCARSPVFKKMMEYNGTESSSNTIIITDCSTAPFSQFLKYLYTGEKEDGTIDAVMPLYSLGDKYDVPVLRDACSNMLQAKISSEPVDAVADVISDVLQIADFHGDSKLKELAASFIVDHFPLVSTKPGWMDLMESKSTLISNILVLVASGLHQQVYEAF